MLLKYYVCMLVTNVQTNKSKKAHIQNEYVDNFYQFNFSSFSSIENYREN